MHRLVFVVSACGALGCSVDTQQGEVGIYRAPAAPSAPEVPGSGGAPPTPDASKTSYFLTLLLRDFKEYDEKDPLTNPAFDNGPTEDSVVETTLGDDRKPVYRAPDNTSPTYGAALFDQWYRDVPDVNLRVLFPLPMSLRADGFYEYDSQKSGQPDIRDGEPRRVFFPLDDDGPYATAFGNQGRKHNQAFTAELHASFVASPGRSVEVRGDDDVYLFIDGKLVIDLGGTHVPITRSVELDELALGAGQTYPIDLFYAERLGGTGDLLLVTDLELKQTL